LFWLPALGPANYSIRILKINYKNQNPSALFWTTQGVFIYFAWRFYLSSKNRIRHGFRNSVAIGNFSNQNSSTYKSLKKKAEADYIEKHMKAFQQEREDYAQKHKIESYNKEYLSVTPLGFGYEGDQLRLEYQIQYDRGQHGDLYFRNYKIFYEQYRWLWFKLGGLVKFILGKEDSPDYVIPWILFMCAVTTSTLSYFGITVLNIFK